jgi:hypothetical protein
MFGSCSNGPNRTEFIVLMPRTGLYQKEHFLLGKAGFFGRDDLSNHKDRKA